MLIDTHCHLAFPKYDADREAVIARARDADIGNMIVIGTDLSSSQQAVELAEKYPFLFAAVGLHPHDAETMNPALLLALETLSHHPKVVAIGETGLDFYYLHASRESQLQAFRAQITLAQKRQLPLVIHARDAWEDISQMIEETDPDYFKQIGSVLHCFTGDRAIADRFTKKGISISFSGIVTFPKTTALQEAASSVDSRYLLLETDAPFLAPQGFRGQRNEPAFLVTTAEKVAALRNCSREDLEVLTTENATRLFKLQPSTNPTDPSDPSDLSDRSDRTDQTDQKRP